MQSSCIFKVTSKFLNWNSPIVQAHRFVKSQNLPQRSCTKCYCIINDKSQSCYIMQMKAAEQRVIDWHKTGIFSILLIFIFIKFWVSLKRYQNIRLLKRLFGWRYYKIYPLLLFFKKKLMSDLSPMYTAMLTRSFRSHWSQSHAKKC